MFLKHLSQDCDKLTGLIEKIKIEAEIHLSALLETEREIAHEN